MLVFIASSAVSHGSTPKRKRKENYEGEYVSPNIGKYRWVKRKTQLFTDQSISFYKTTLLTYKTMDTKTEIRILSGTLMVL